MSVVKEKKIGSSFRSKSVYDLYFNNDDLRDSIKTLRTNIEFAGIDKEIKSIGVTSAEMGVGKSTISICLAIAMAEAGKRTLIIDNDFRNPQIANRLGIRCRFTLNDLLAGRIELQDVCIPTEINKLYCFDLGNRRVSNPVEVLSSSRYKEIIGQLYESFDLIIIDTPPIGLFVDGAVISSLVDGMIMVARKGKSKPSEINEAVAQLEKANAHIIGAVLNGVEHSASNYYYYYSRQGQKKKKRRT